MDTIARGLAAQARSLTTAGAPVYPGQVLCRTAMVDTLNAGVTQAVCQHADFVREDISAANPLRLVHGNFHCTAAGEQASGARSWADAIEYPAGSGSFYPVTWGGAAQVDMTDGQALAASDPWYVPGVTIARGTQINIQTWQSGTGGIIYGSSSLSSAALGDKAAIGGAKALLGTAFAGSAGGNVFGPFAGVAATRRPAVASIGDSRLATAGATSGAGVFVGHVANAVAGQIGHLNLASGGSQVAVLATEAGFARRKLYLPYASHAVQNGGVNDYNVGTSAAAILAARDTVRSYAPALRWFETTMEPRSTSSDGWTSTTGQTPSANEATRVAVNAAVRRGRAGFEGWFEIADRFESARDTGRWAVGDNMRAVTDAAMTAGSAVLSSASAAFSAGDVGATVYVPGAGASGGALTSAITSVQSVTGVTLATTASTTVSNASARIGGLTSDGLHVSAPGLQRGRAAVPVELLRQA
jgi:hypothetical protein